MVTAGLHLSTCSQCPLPGDSASLPSEGRVGGPLLSVLAFEWVACRCSSDSLGRNQFLHLGFELGVKEEDSHLPFPAGT